jgi:hypothetical protein
VTTKSCESERVDGTTTPEDASVDSNGGRRTKVPKAVRIQDVMRNEIMELRETARRAVAMENFPRGELERLVGVLIANRVSDSAAAEAEASQEKNAAQFIAIRVERTTKKIKKGGFPAAASLLPELVERVVVAKEEARSKEQARRGKQSPKWVERFKKFVYENYKLWRANPFNDDGSKRYKSKAAFAEAMINQAPANMEKVDNPRTITIWVGIWDAESGISKSSGKPG